VKIVGVKVDYIKFVGLLKDHFQHADMVRDWVYDMPTIKSERSFSDRYQISTSHGIAAREQGNLVALIY